MSKLFGAAVRVVRCTGGYFVETAERCTGVENHRICATALELVVAMEAMFDAQEGVEKLEEQRLQAGAGVLEMLDIFKKAQKAQSAQDDDPLGLRDLPG